MTPTRAVAKETNALHAGYQNGETFLSSSVRTKRCRPRSVAASLNLTLVQQPLVPINLQAAIYLDPSSPMSTLPSLRERCPNLFKGFFFVLLICSLVHRLAVRISLPFYILCKLLLY